MITLLLLIFSQLDEGSATSIREVIPAGRTHIVHIRDWHLLPEDAFAADTGLDGEQLAAAYAEHRDLVKKVQVAQRQLLGDAKAVYVEGLAPSDMLIFTAMIRLQRKSPDEAVQLKLGAAGQLMVEHKLRVFPAEADGFEKANPVRDGKVDIDTDVQEEREDAIVKNLLKRKGKVYLVLGGAHDLADNIRRLSKGCGYTVVTPKGYPPEALDQK
jgi:hypothetical protein